MGSTDLPLHNTPLGESPPPRPRTCFGRDELIEKVVGLAETLTPVALIGAGGIGKTSIALTVLHHDRIKQRFGHHRRFIRCDQFPASPAHFLSRLSKVIGAGAENPENLSPLRPFLSQTEMILVLDNAESILDPQGPNAREVNAVIEELSQFETISLCITSRISTVPRHCKRPTIPTLSTDSACDIFYGIYDDGAGRSDIVSDLLRRLDFHALSIALLATTASHNMWDYDRLAREWDTQRVQILRTDYNESMAATIELSLASPTFRELGPSARDLLGVIAFFPQGVNENNLDWLLPAISKRRTILDKLCVLSLTYRSNGFITMLAPLRDYLRPEDPRSSPLLQATKELYFTQLLTYAGFGEPGFEEPGFEEVQWITLDSVNIEHLLDIFTSIDAGSIDVWEACCHFMGHHYRHIRRLVVFGSKIEGLPDDHPSKPDCLTRLSLLFDSVGNHVERKRLLLRALGLWREHGDNRKVANTLVHLSGANRRLGLNKEGIQQVEEASEIYKQLNDISGQAYCLQKLARLLYHDGRFNAAEDTAMRAINIFSEGGNQFSLCQCYHILGSVCCSKGETEKAINHFEAALKIASPPNWHGQLFCIHYSLARLFFDQNGLGDAHAHIERAKLIAANLPRRLGNATMLQVAIWRKERKFEEAKSGVLRAADEFEKIGATADARYCGAILRAIQKEMKTLGAS